MANQPLGPPPGMTVLPTPKLPITQLESLKFKATQIIESIHGLQWTLDAGGRPDLMLAWPDILSKYNMLLSQTHNFSTALVHPFPTSNTTSKTAPPNIYERIALHPNRAMADIQLDADVIPLLRNQQTTDVLRTENDTVRRLAEHMSTRGSVGVLGISPPPAAPAGFGAVKKPEYEDVLQECAGIRSAHDRRVERAVRAVDMLKEKFDWKQRVMVEVEEPEELDWDPRMGRTETADVAMSSASEDESESESGEEEDEAEAAPNEEVAPVVVNSDEDDEFNVEGALFNTSPTAEFGVLSSFGMDAT